MTHRFLIILLLLAPGAVAAQDLALPDLAPREIEIRGELTISFPSLRRQPLAGFNPPPRVPEIPANRRPYADEYRQTRADLPASPLQPPQPPDASAYASGPSYTGSVEGGFGRYGARYALVDWAAPVGRSTRLSLNGGYRGISNFRPFKGRADSISAANGGELRARVQHAGSRIGFGLDADGFIHQYRLYGAVPGAGSASLEAPLRDGNGGRIGVWLRSAGPGAIQYRSSLTASGNRMETNAFSASGRSDPRTLRTDAHLIVDLGVEASTNRSTFLIDAKGGKQSMETGISGPRDVGYGESALGLRTDLPGGGLLEIGARVVGFDARASATGSTQRRVAYLSPDIRFEGALSPSVRLTVRNRARVEAHDLAEMMNRNPYIVDEPDSRPALYAVDASAALALTTGNVTLTGTAGYQDAPSYRYFVADPATFLNYPAGISSARYGDAHIRFARVEAGAVIRPGVQGRVGVTIRSGTLQDTGSDIPYLSTWEAFGVISAAFANGDGLLQAVGRVDGPRAITTDGVIDLPALVDIDLSASYFLTPAAALVVRVQNLGPKRAEWDQYPIPPAILTGGVQWRW